jgi:L-ribulose-5-phosphate 3-epimerase
VVEGGFSWENGLRLLLPKIKMIVLKDFRWEKVDGKWITLNTPVGEGNGRFQIVFSDAEEGETQTSRIAAL